jgi:hypothetical protein
MNITVESLKSLMGLAQRKDKLNKEIAKVEAQLAALLGGQAAPKAGKPAKKAATKKAAAKKAPRKGKRGSVGKKVLAALESAGPAGVKVADLAKSLGLKNANLHVWFATTGKKHTKKVGRGHYRLK